MKIEKVKITVLGLLLFISVSAFSQMQTFNHPELDWRTIETDHYYIHFHQGTERTARLTAKIAEQIYDPITSLYSYEPDGRIHFIVRDHGDVSNGAAYYYNNKIELWAPSLEFFLRGSHNWLRNVITHEFSHMISLGAARKLTRQIPAVYVQWLGYEEEKRPDVIHGYPNRLVSFPLAGTVIPMWFAEGVAQFQRTGLDYDTWDTHRDMVLRTACLEDRLLGIKEMGVFGKKGLGNERVYNQGYGFTLYLAYTYGEEKLNQLIHSLSRPLHLSFSQATSEVLGKDNKELYEDWKQWLLTGYFHHDFNNSKNYKVLENKGSGNYYPVMSPDSKKVAYISSRGNDYSSQSNLWMWNFKTGKKRMIQSGVTSSVSWLSDTSLVYAKKTDLTVQGSHYYDLYIYDLGENREKRLTHHARTQQPDVSSEYGKIVCVVQEDGTCNIVVYDVNNEKLKKITHYHNGEQIYTPRWMSEGRIVFTFTEGGGSRNIACIDSSGSEFEYLIKDSHDARDAFPSPDGTKLYYSSDDSGIFNIYCLNMISGSIKQLTSVSGGAFMPARSKDNRLVFSLFTADGYKIAYLDSVSKTAVHVEKYKSPYREIREWRDSQQIKISSYDDKEVPDYKSRPYKHIFSKLSFFPRIMSDYPGKLKLGSYFSGSDFLDKISIFGGAALNTQFDTDLFCIFNYRELFPTLFLEAFNQSRHTEVDDIDYGFNLIEVDIGADWPLGDNHMLRTAYIFSRYDANMSFEEQNQQIDFSYNYHLGSDIHIRWDYQGVKPGASSGIAPDYGRNITFQAKWSHNKFLDDFGVHKNYGTMVEIYKPYNFYAFNLDWYEYLPGLFKRHSSALRLKAGYIDRSVDDFYYFFGGGLEGLKGYSFYSLQGKKLLQFDAAYRFPVCTNINTRLWFLHLHKLYLSVYAQAGNIWSSEKFDTAEIKRDVGVQLRLQMFSFYTFPLCLTFDSVYGFDRYKLRGNTYGDEWRFYFGVLFDFLD
ncbi:MAG: hypothetical protein R6V04_13845 [bacterium]